MADLEPQADQLGRMGNAAARALAQLPQFMARNIFSGRFDGLALAGLSVPRRARSPKCYVV